MRWYRWYLIRRSRLPGWFGHDSMAVWPFVLDTSGAMPASLLRHEVQHLRQQLVVAALGVALVLVLPVSRWWLCAVHPLPFLALYGLSCLRGYRHSWFERDAERHR